MDQNTNLRDLNNKLYIIKTSQQRGIYMCRPMIKKNGYFKLQFKLKMILSQIYVRVKCS